MNPIIPDNDASGENTYISTKSKGSSSVEKKTVSDIKNLSGEKVTAAQQVSESSSKTLTSSISGSKSHTISNSVKVGTNVTIVPDIWSSSAEYTRSWSDLVTNGWTKSEGTTVTDRNC